MKSDKGLKNSTEVVEWSSGKNYTILEDETRGRYLVANRNLVPGEKIIEEFAFAYVVNSCQRKTVCAKCLAVADPDICCDDCGQVAFCSENCKELMDTLHSLECEALESVDRIARTSKADLDLTRILIRILCERSLNCHQEETTTTSQSESSVRKGTFEEVLNLVHFESLLSEAWNFSIECAAQLVLQHLPVDLNTQDIVQLAATINANSHGLVDTHGRNCIIGFGLFTASSLINHSCFPNCVYTNMGDGKLIVRTLEHVQAGEELTIHYIDLYQSRNKRKQELLNTKHFDCRCQRCTTKMEISSDRWIDGFCCVECSIYQDNDMDKKKETSCFVKNDDDKTSCFVKNDDVDDETSCCVKNDDDETSCFVKDIVLNDEGLCPRCNKSYCLQTLRSLEQTIQMKFQEAIHQKNSSDSRNQFEQLLESYRVSNTTPKSNQKVLHPYHQIVFETLVQLVKLCHQQCDYSAMANYSRQLIHCMLQIYPSNFLEIGEFYYMHGKCLEALRKKHSIKDVPIEPLIQETIESFQKCYYIRKICLGDNHYLTKEISNYLKDVIVNA